MNEETKDEESGIGTVLSGIATGVSVAVSVLTAPLTILSTLGAVLGAAASAISAVLGAILTPAGLVVAALVAIGAYAIYASGAAGTALDWLSARFGELLDAGRESLQGIKDALAAGDISLAARILWLSLKAAWQRGIFELTAAWLGFKEQFLSVATGAFYGAVALVAEAFYGLKRIWAQTVNFWSDLLGKFGSFFVKTWNGLVDWAAKAWTKVRALIDPTINVEAVNKQIDRMSQQRNLEVSKSTLDARLAREQDLQGIETERKSVAVSIAEMAGQEDTQRRAKFAQKLADSQKALEEARAEWKGALDQARDARAARDTGQANRPSLPDIDLPDITQRAQSAVDVAGTFNVAAIAQLGVGDTAKERTAKATEETARNTRRIIQKMDEDELSFT